MTAVGKNGLVCAYCRKKLLLGEIDLHMKACAHDRISKLEGTVSDLARVVDRLAEGLIKAGLVEEFRP